MSYQQIWTLLFGHCRQVLKPVAQNWKKVWAPLCSGFARSLRRIVKRAGMAISIPNAKESQGLLAPQKLLEKAAGSGHGAVSGAGLRAARLVQCGRCDPVGFDAVPKM